ncbi:DUF4331 domain-containing protein [Cryptosporangium aurantiacum]|uniref:DUF4331 domain-containing protein n=1 Tax=Cryptosporangium aurantiacum TaxID=134849 RepID=A0A1M7KV07_9ACTN|nr:DUF4331 domain-containing protein [Cryptosporangium aurantiacum]SHM68872.1 protein of unknown function [Cryptosporangium aurantiacum]
MTTTPQRPPSTPPPGSPPPARRTRLPRRTTAALAAGGLALATAVTGLGPGTAQSSSHREAPLIAADPAVDNTDFYAMASPDTPGSILLVANFQPFEEPNGGPNFYPFATDAAYKINVDNDGDAKPDVVFRWTFKNDDQRKNDTFLYNNGQVTSLDDENLLFKQFYTLEVSYDGGNRYSQTIAKNAPVAPSFVGKASMPDYKALREQAVVKKKNVKAFAGQADDPFFADLRVFDLLYGGDLSEVGEDTLGGYNVNSIALQVPAEALALKNNVKRNPVVGLWSTTERNRVRISGNTKAKLGNDTVQVSRLGNPLVNEVVLPAGLKDAFNALRPDQDADVQEAVDRVTDPELPKLIEQIYKIPAPDAPREDLVEIFLTGIAKAADGPIDVDLNSQLLNRDVNAKKFRASEMLRLNLGNEHNTKPDRLGLLAGDTEGFPNGRRLGDDVVDIAIQVMEGAAQEGKLVDALAAGDKVNENDVRFEREFPFVALPNEDGVNQGGSSPQTDNVAAIDRLGPTGVSLITAVTTTAILCSIAGFVAWYRRRPTTATLPPHRGRRRR